MHTYRCLIVSALAVCSTVAWASATWAQTVTYDLGPETALLDAAFYAGEVADGSNLAGRQLVFYGISPDGSQVAFSAINNATFETGLFVVDVGDPSSWRRLTPDETFSVQVVFWSPDGERIFVGSRAYDAANGNLEYDLDLALGVGIRPAAVTRLPSGNWLSTNHDGSVDNAYEAWLAPIRPNGELDTSRQVVQVTNLNLGFYPGPHVVLPAISADGTQLQFYVYAHQTPPTSVPDLSDIYVLNNLQAVINASKIASTSISSLAPTSLSDPDVVPLRAAETANFVAGGGFSEDGTLSFVAEDLNNTFNDNNFFASVATGAWDIFVCDGLTGADYQISRPGNQASLKMFPGGARATYTSDVGGSLNLFATALEVTTSVSGTTVGNPVDNVIQTTTTQTQADGSGTLVDVPSGTTIDFPDGEPQAIVISTPIDPVSEAELPPNAAVDALPVVREFGPDGTTFNPPIEVTISYTDAEIQGMDENDLVLYLYNDSTNVFDIAIPEVDIVLRDPENNRITFLTDHFSIFGLGGSLITAAPHNSRMLPILLGVLAIVAACALRRRDRVRKPSK